MLKAAKPLGLVVLHDPSFPGVMSKNYSQRRDLVQKLDRGWDVYGRLQYSWIWVQNYKQSILLILMNPWLGVLLIGAVQPFLDYFVADFDWSAAV
ncbi:hypothetical protein J1N35_045620 [Gossypium stocksii]|uniref:Uncharacterized protein n=1 Tax=Gossypium stocksii TaxID=47602 RepID=A0A9D3UBC9_9ROSI|nr:hypothetical protein J1N35_045620 [Gossypium stocksii]